MRQPARKVPAVSDDSAREDARGCTGAHTAPFAGQPGDVAACLGQRTWDQHRGIHYLLNALLDKGLIKLGNFSAAEDKRRYAYVLTPKGAAEKVRLTKAFLARKMVEYEALRAEIEAMRAEIDAEDAQENRT